MKYRPIFKKVLFLFLVYSLINDINSQEISNFSFPIVKVHFYSSQADIERSGSVKISKGRNSIEINNLTEKLDENSIRVLVKNKSQEEKIKILSLEVESHQVEENYDLEIKESDELVKTSQFKLKKLTDEYLSLQEEENTIQSIEFAKIPDPKTKKNTNINIHLNQWESNLDFVQNALKVNHIKSIKLLDDIDSARSELNLAIFISNKYNSKRKQNFKSLKIEIDSKEYLELPLTIIYRTSGASWYPVYTAKLLDGDKSSNLKLVSYALVKNETGEPWINIKSSYSATDPNESAVLPKLKQWKIESRLVSKNEAYSPRKKIASAAQTQSKTSQSYNEMQDLVVDDYEENDRSQPKPNLQKSKVSKDYYSSNLAQIKDKRANRKSEQTQEVLDNFQSNVINRDQNLSQGRYEDAIKYSNEVLQNIESLDPKYKKHFKDEQIASEKIKRQALEMQEKKDLLSKLIRPKTSKRGFDYFYEVNTRETIPSDSAYRKIFLSEKTLETDLFYEANPIVQNLSFLIGNISYKESNPILEGPISIFHNFDYLGESILKNVSKKEPFKLNLGADEDIQITRSVEKFREVTGIINKSYENKYNITIKVKNRKKIPILIDVYDRIPVPSNDLIKVQIESISPKPFEIDKNYGLYKYRMNLAPNKEETIKIQYKINHSTEVRSNFNESGKQW